eukprot:1340735-Rhodomonas_salina.4
MTSNPASEFGIRIRIPVTCSGSFLPLFKCSLDCVTGSVTFLGTLAFCDFMRVVCDLTKVLTLRASSRVSTTRSTAQVRALTACAAARGCADARRMLRSRVRVLMSRVLSCYHV